MPEATPKREAVRERMVPITCGQCSWVAGRGSGLQERRRQWIYLGVVLDGFLDYRGDGELALRGHDRFGGGLMKIVSNLEKSSRRAAKRRG